MYLKNIPQINNNKKIKTELSCGLSNALFFVCLLLFLIRFRTVKTKKCFFFSFVI